MADSLRRIDELDVEGRRVLLRADFNVPLDRPQPGGPIEVPDGWSGLDIGPRTSARYAVEIAAAGTVFWNGPMGRFELEPFAAGTRAVAEAAASTPARTVVGGGETVQAMRSFGVGDRATHLSTGGGATLEFLEGRQLPGVHALTNAVVSAR
jgi:phosphoglycerate kinase